MKVKILYLFIALTFLSGTSEVFSQKKNPREKSAKNLYNTLATSLRQAKEVPSKLKGCDAAKVLKSIPRKKLLPTEAHLEKEIGRIVDDSLKGYNVMSLFKTYPDMFSWFSKTTNISDFLTKQDIDYTKLDKEQQESVTKHYQKMQRFQKSGFKIYTNTFNHKDLKVSVETILRPLRYSKHPEKPTITIIDWDIITTVRIECKCTIKNKHRVKLADYEYTSRSTGPMIFDSWGNYGVVVLYGLRFGPVKLAKYTLKKLECCKELKDPVEDGSFVDPNENINDKNTLLDTGVGLGFGSEVETNIGFSGGVLFNVAEIGGNPLFVGPKATVSTTSITNEDIKELRVLVGPTAEYQIPLNDGRTRIVTGVNSGYIFGNVESFGFDQDFSGITVNTYAGAQINVGNNLVITALLNFLEFSSLTFKSDMENFENTTSNTTFLTDGGAISVGVRIGLD